jgi:ubiquinone/menaquinone biosynthesis C-methylase UbiE
MKESALKKEKTRSAALYDRVASRYDRALAPLEKRFLRRLRSQALSLLPANSRILEVGAGTGLNFPFYPPGARGVASELSCEMIKLARAKEHPRGVTLVQASAERLPFQDESFDAALATLVFCSISSPEIAFSELRRVVRPGGQIVLLEHVRPEGILGYFFDALNVLTVALFDDHFNRQTALEAKRAGLQLQGVERRAFGIVNLIVCRN